MLQLAKLYENELVQLFYKNTLREDMKWVTFGVETSPPKLPEAYGTDRIFVSVQNDQILGYLGYSIDWAVRSAYNLFCVRLSDNNGVVFFRDLKRLVDGIWDGNIQKLNYQVIVGNPAERMWDKFCFAHGGRIVGTYKKDIRLADGFLYDRKVYEIMKEDYRR